MLSFDSGHPLCAMCGLSFLCAACKQPVNPRYNYCVQLVNDELRGFCGTRARDNVPSIQILRRIKLPMKQIILDIGTIRGMKSFANARRNAVGSDNVTADEAGIIIAHALENKESSPSECCDELRWASKSRLCYRDVIDLVMRGMQIYRGNSEQQQPKHPRTATNQRDQSERDIADDEDDSGEPTRQRPRNQ